MGACEPPAKGPEGGEMQSCWGELGLPAVEGANGLSHIHKVKELKSGEIRGRG